MNCRKSEAYISLQPCWDIIHGFVHSDVKVNLIVSTGRQVCARQCSARFLASWTAADQRAEQGSCTLLNINAGENKCDPLLSSPDLSLSLSLPGILLPALPAASSPKHPRAVAAEQEESQSEILSAKGKESQSNVFQCAEMQISKKDVSERHDHDHKL